MFQYSYMLFHVNKTPQLRRSTTPSLRLWDAGMAVPSLLKEKEGSQESGSGNTTTLTLQGECPSFTSSICVQSEWRAKGKEHKTEAVTHLLSFEILQVSHFASVLSPSCSIQLRYGFIWSKVIGNTRGRSMVEMELFDNERLTQVSGVSDTCKLQGCIKALLEVTSAWKYLKKKKKKLKNLNLASQTGRFLVPSRLSEVCICWRVHVSACQIWKVTAWTFCLSCGLVSRCNQKK